MWRAQEDSTPEHPKGVLMIIGIRVLPDHIGPLEPKETSVRVVTRGKVREQGKEGQGGK